MGSVSTCTDLPCCFHAAEDLGAPQKPQEMALCQESHREQESRCAEERWQADLSPCVLSFEEGGRRKCGQYWPLEKDSRVRFGFLTVTNLGVENMNHYKKTTLEIHNTEVRHGFVLSFK